MQEIWYKNKPTLIKALVTLVLFMVLSNVAKGIRGDHESDLQIHEEKSVVLAQKLQGLNGVVDVERKSRSALEDRASDLFSKVSISARPVHAIPDDPDSIVTEFKRSKDSVWNDFRERANRLGILSPSSVPNFQEKSDLTSNEWADRYRLLEVMDRFLSVILQVQLESVDEIAPGERSQEEFSDSGLALVRYPVTFKLRCSPAQLSELFVRFQSDNVFLSLEPERMSSTEASGDLVEVTMKVVGVDVEEPREESQGTRRNSRFNRRG
jgi:hypothetical protein